MKIYASVVDSIGNTPLVRLNNVVERLHAEVLVKCEFRNPLFSVKDRVALSMVKDAEERGVLTPGSLIVEATSGNTGIGLAFVARARGYRCLLVLPETMSMERKKLLRMLGAEIELTPGSLGMKGAVARAQEICREQDAFMPDQFGNPANPQAHYLTTGVEILDAVDGRVDVFVAGVGTGGTISGVGKRLKESVSGVRIVAVEPAESPVLSGGVPGPHVIQGIGAGFVPAIYDGSVVDEIICVKGADALTMARRINAEEGIPVGISSGANITAALEIARRPDMRGKRIVTVAASAVERYMSTALVPDLA